VTSRNSTPPAVLKRIAANWGWSALRRERRTFDDTTAGARSVVWYECGEVEYDRRAFFLQINECPIGQQTQYAAAVYALRYRLCSGWHCFRLPHDAPGNRARIAALSEFLGRDHFDTLPARRAFRLSHPECAGYTWRRIRRSGTPYEIVDARASKTRPPPQR